MDIDARLARLRKQRNCIDRAVQALEELEALYPDEGQRSSARGLIRKILRLPERRPRLEDNDDPNLNKSYG